MTESIIEKLQYLIRNTQATGRIRMSDVEYIRPQWQLKSDNGDAMVFTHTRTMEPAHTEMLMTAEKRIAELREQVGEKVLKELENRRKL